MLAGVVVALTDAGVARLDETAPVHLRGVARHFVSQLDDAELDLLERALVRSHGRLHVRLRDLTARRGI